MPGREIILDVRPRIPEALARLPELAEDLWYSWHRPTRALFATLDPALWDRVTHNPKLFLRQVAHGVLEGAAADEVYRAQYQEVLLAYDTYHGQPPRPAEAGLADDDLVAYLCAEYGLHESLPIYSGGLGILAGHHCKTASDLRLPFVAVGLLYRSGYFSQTIDHEGNQVARVQASDFDALPVRVLRDADGEEVRIGVPMPGREVVLRVWEARAGNVRVLLLDANVPENGAEDRRITGQLYDSDRDVRIRQELVLGIGGVRALRRAGHEPTVWHLNEGHPAFSAVERIRELVAEGEDFAAAVEAVAASTVFTTHTPVPAGHDTFARNTVSDYLAPLLAPHGIEMNRVLALGIVDGDREFSMTNLAIKGSRRQNGVSRIHGAVSARISERCWPELPPDENPMDYVTNGVHVPTVLVQDWVDLFDRNLGAEWRNHLCDAAYWERIHQISDQLFWGVRQSIKSKTVQRLRQWLWAQHARNHVSEPHIERLLDQLNPEEPNVLTIGFARRFASYKRSTLLFNDLDWLRELVSDAERPVVFVFAGKAHPADEPGKALLRRIHEVGWMREFTGKILLVEGYDLVLARALVAGVDVWLNNPVYPQEASGTSGMKAAINGTPNLSVTDGWWAEGFEGDNGWAIKPSPHLGDEHRRDAEDARTLYEILQDKVIPLYYDHGRHGYSPGWVRMCKRSMASILPRFNMNRVVQEYATKLYAPAASKGRLLAAQGRAGARALAEWRARVEGAWPRVSLRALHDGIAPATFGERIPIEVAVQLDGLEPGDVVVELVVAREPREEAAPVGAGPHPFARPGLGEGGPPWSQHLALVAGERIAETGEHRYRLEYDPAECGRHSARIRAYPWHEMLSHPLETGLMAWLD